ncbi:glycine cleavage system protein H [Candidatus Borrarchaeum sp.]|uniref:glycine cleavage system protein H n=1 Tax=Candidatus Borrarchaeum sp. TaxID=2846742 RepID=UPI00257DE306|nr:glycine cleavage system protein H [Candidatus Borrarchaeum sp.]
MPITITYDEKRIFIMLDDLYYWSGAMGSHPGHIWMSTYIIPKIRVGIDDFGVYEAGEIKYIRLPSEAGGEVKQGKVFGTLEAGKYVGPLISPISGKIVEVNQKIKEQPLLLNEDCYDEGWLIKVEPSNLDEEIKNPNIIYSEKAIEEWMKGEFEKFKVAGTVRVVNRTEYGAWKIIAREESRRKA